MAGEGGGPVADPADLLRLVPPRVVRVEPGDEELGVAAERREEVVEVVGDAARQASDCVQLLCVEELLLESLPLRDVLDEGDCVRELAVRIAHGRAGETAPAHRSEEHTSELQSPCNLVCRLLLEKKKRRTT